MNGAAAVRGAVVAGLAALVGLAGGVGVGEDVRLKNGMAFSGKPGKIAEFGEAPAAGEAEESIKPIFLLDDDLKRVYFPTKQIVSTEPSIPTPRQTIELSNHRVAKAGQKIGILGGWAPTSEWDEFGRRTVRLTTADGPIDVIQGITRITPSVTWIEGLSTKRSYVWDMRVATDSLPRDLIRRILPRHLDWLDPNDRLLVVRLYIQAERYSDAAAELEQVTKDFPELTEPRKLIPGLHQRAAQKLIDEIGLRKEAGQHRLAATILAGFPADGVATETLVRVRDLFREYEDEHVKGDKFLVDLKAAIDGLADPAQQAEARAVYAEIQARMNFNTLPRAESFIRLADDRTLTPSRRVALAVSGWMLGTDKSGTDLAESLSVVRVRDLVRAYMNTTTAGERQGLVDRIKAEQAGTPGRIAEILAYMHPPRPLPEHPLEARRREAAAAAAVPPSTAPASDATAIPPPPSPPPGETPAPPAAPEPLQPQSEDEEPGYYKLTVPGLEGETYTYHVQLPPEYDPHRRYPCLVTLTGRPGMARQQMRFWTGPYHPDTGTHLGQAARHGTIILSPEWARPDQTSFQSTAREAAAVLFPLRDAMLRLAIDTDRVFLSGHSMGGDAAWDLGVSHPDLWAGVIPIVATSTRYVPRYHQNARYTSWLFLGGELDADWRSANKTDFNRYFKNAGYDVIVFEYQGRGHEGYADALLDIFRWMGLHQRPPAPKEFACESLRPWDNFFWYVETTDFPPATMVVPAEFEYKTVSRPALTEGRTLATNGLTVRGGGASTKVHLSPEVVAFGKKVTVNGKSYEAVGDVATLLEDVRRRGDRYHPVFMTVDGKR